MACLWGGLLGNASQCIGAQTARILLDRAGYLSMAESGRVSSAYSDRRLVGLFAAALVLLLVVRLLTLAFGGTDLFFDEAQYWYWSLEPDFGYYSKPPLIAWIIRMSTDSCGLSEFCIRLPSPVIHMATSAVVCAIGARLYDLRIGVIAGLVFATLPGVSVSSALISTDVPLLFCWALAMFALVAMVQTKQWWPALLLGLALGCGFNAKYAMAWFFACLVIHLLVAREQRWLAKDARLYLAVLIGVAMIVPNLYWNYAHGFATFSHTADNARWAGSLGHPKKALEFFLSQFGVFGPILFGALLVISWRAFARGVMVQDRFLLAFSVPVILVILVQAYLSRAHANWAAVAYVAATVLVTATMVRDVAWGWLKASFAVHLAILAFVVVGTVTAGRLDWPGGADPFARTLGWSKIAEAAKVEIDKARDQGRPFSAVVSDMRSMTAELLYYLKDTGVPVYSWRRSERPRDHFELVRPFKGEAEGPVLLVSLIGKRSPVIKGFSSSKELAKRDIAAGKNKSRSVVFYAVSGYISK